MITVFNIQTQLKLAYKPVSKRQVFRYLKAAGVEPLNQVSRPRMYPDNAHHRVLTYLGFEKGKAVISVPKLRAERAQSQKRRAA